MFSVIFVAALLALAAGQAEEINSEEIPSTHVPHLISESSLFQVHAGNAVVLPCDVDELGDYSLLWKKEKTEFLSMSSTSHSSSSAIVSTVKLTKNKRFQIFNDSLSLSISNVQLNDSGEYTCHITSNPPVMLMHTLDVLYPPTVQTRPQNGMVTVREDDTLALVCDATGNPKPQITWKHAGIHYPATHENQFIINKAEKSNSGVYECVADNGVGDPAAAIFKVEVVSAPKIVREPENGLMAVKEGDNISISCRATGDPPPVIMWKKPGTDKSQRGRDGDRIIISQADRTHSGQYECIATNPMGVFTSALITVQVLYPPEIEVRNTRIHAGEGTTVNITCTVQGEPMPLVMWKTSNDELIHSSDRYHVNNIGNNHILEIKDLMEEDFGKYQCTANNSLGTSSEDIHIIGIPQTPLFTSKPHGSQGTRYTLTWTVTSHTSIDDYILMYRKKSDGEPEEWISLSIPALNQPGIEQSHTYQLTSLDPATSYEAVVKARNKFGSSKQSDTLVFTTKHEDNRSEAMESSCSTLQCTTLLMIFGFISITMFSSSTPYQRGSAESNVTN